MHVNYSGWNETHGSFSCKIYINERKEDYELHFSDGSIAKQRSPFQVVTADWNHDGDVYSQYGAWFSERKGGYAEFWTPEQMVSELVDAMDPNSKRSGKHVVSIPGVTIPLPDRRPSLDDQILKSENRAMHQDIERNRKMNVLGIRPPREPWAR